LAKENSSLCAIVWHCFAMLCLAILVQYWVVLDGQTDGQMQGHSKYLASIVSHG